MRKKLLSKLITRLRICIAAFILVLLSLFLFSFTVQKLKDDFLKQLGISKAEADGKITSSLLSGSLDHYGIRNLKNILVNDRAAVVKDIATYAKQYANSDAFKKEYAALKERNKPAPAQKIDTPEEVRANLIKMAKEYVASSETSLKNATPQTQKIFTEMLDAAKKNLKEAEDPNNKTIKMWAQNYEEMKKMTQQSWENSMKDWEAKYPANHLLYVKVNLQAFLDATEGIDFSASLYDKNGKKYFVNKEYERKDSRWKMAFRAGKDAVETARAFASQWISEIK
ncbi:MAG: hypothetical protein IPP96_16890 [Chitinophagaceae bacterium]|nr:hypothetical protein [Chitinophagaceae bacterium]